MAAEHLGQRDTDVCLGLVHAHDQPFLSVHVPDVAVVNFPDIGISQTGIA